MQYKTIVLIDGENLVCRYQEMISNGKIPLNEVLYNKDCFVWIPSILDQYGCNDIVRASYYTTVVGDEKRVDELNKEISEAKFIFTSLTKDEWYGTLVPHVFKKSLRKTKTKSVDINIAIDALRYAYGTTIDKIILISGDGDYIPLLREIMSKGKMVQVYAFSSGLHKDILCNCDDLYIIDDVFFESDEPTSIQDLNP